MRAAQLFVVILLLCGELSAQPFVQKVVESHLFQGAEQASSLLKSQEAEAKAAARSQTAQANTQDPSLQTGRAQAYLDLFNKVFSPQSNQWSGKADEFSTKVEKFERLADQAFGILQGGDYQKAQALLAKGGPELHQWVVWSRPIAGGTRFEKLDTLYGLTFIAQLQQGVTHPPLSEVRPSESTGLPYDGPFTPTEQQSGLAANPHWKLADYLIRLGAYHQALEQLEQVSPPSPLVRMRQWILLSEMGKTPDEAPPILTGREERLQLLLSQARIAERDGQFRELQRTVEEGLSLSSNLPLHQFLFYSAEQRLEMAGEPYVDVDKLQDRLTKALDILQSVPKNYKAPPHLWQWTAVTLDDWTTIWEEAGRALPPFQDLSNRLDLISLERLQNPDFDRSTYLLNPNQIPSYLERTAEDSWRTHQSLQGLVTEELPTRYAGRSGLALMGLAEKQVAAPSPSAAQVKEALRLLREAQSRLSQGHDQRALRLAKLREAEILTQFKPTGWQSPAKELVSDILLSPVEIDFRVRAHLVKGRVLHSEGQTELAIKKLQTGAEELESFLQEAPGGAQTLLLMRTRFQPLFRELTLWNLESGAKESALMAQETGALLEKQAAQPAPTEEIAEKRAAITILKQQLSVADLPANRERLEKEREVLGSLVSSLKQRPGFRNVLNTTPSGLQQIQTSLDEESAVLQPFLTQSQLYLFLITKTALKVEKIPVGGINVDSEIASIRYYISRPSPANTSTLLRKLNAFYNMMVAPIQDDLEGVKTLAIVTSGSLNHLPFQALVDVDQAGKPHYLAEKFAVVSLLRAGDITRMSGDVVGARGSWLLFGNPDGSLPASEQETRNIRSAYPQAALHMGKDAKEELLFTKGGEQRVLHLATHGKVISGNPDQSFLVLASKDGSPTKLTRGEILSKLALPNTRLVTLSACQTALNDPGEDSQVNSLADAFWSKGARSVIGSLWSVPDQSTSEFMTRYYQELAKGKEHAEAFQTAQKSLFSNAPTAHPYFWSGFIYWGDWRGTL